MVGLTTVATGCGGSVTPRIAGYGATPAGASTAAGPTLQAAANPSGATSIALSPQLYAPGSGCAPVGKTTGLGAVPQPCAQQWIAYTFDLVPGQDVIDASKMAKTALVAPGVDPAAAKADATAFYLDEVLGLWAENKNMTDLVAALDGPTWASHDPALKFLQEGDTIVQAEDCLLPTTVTVTKLDDNARSYFLSKGFVEAGDVALVVTFPACKGMYVGSMSTAGWQLGIDKPGSGVITGSVRPGVAGASPMFFIGAEGTCGTPELKQVCGD